VAKPVVEGVEAAPRRRPEVSPLFSTPIASGGEGEESEAQRALVQRPRISVATRVAAVFAVLFLLVAGVTMLAVVLISEIRVKQGFLEKAANYEFEIQQARRYEKNFFLYGTNLHDAMTSTETALAYLDRDEDELRTVVGATRLAVMRGNVTAYGASLERLLRISETPSTALVDERVHLETVLRHHGAQIVADAREMVDRERIAMHAMLHTSLVAAGGFVVFMLFVMAAVGGFLTRTVLRPLGRFVAYTDRIGQGDYSPITPVRKYRDEFSNLAVALNHMLRELKAHQERLVHSEKMAAVGTLTSGIAHELNNPLNNISLNTEALIEDFASLPDEAKLRMLDQIATQVERATATVHQLLDFTRKSQSGASRVAVRWLLESALKLVANELSLAGVEARLEVAEDVPPIVGDVRSLQQVFLNLFLNAIQAMAGGGTLTITARLGEDRWVKVTVRDTGIGIAAANLAKVFDPFFTTKEPGEGTGLGLAVSYAIIEKHGGTISVDSVVGEGTTFTVALPAGNAG
jgi:two-component system NtrC family sensor kinase